METKDKNTSDDKKIVLSGIRATGNLHLGNYYGALSKFVRMQDDYDCRYFVADLHALTTAPDPAVLHENVKNILANILPPVLTQIKTQSMCRVMFRRFPKCIC